VTHSRKILSQAGVSLADIYDVEGSIVGLEELDVTDIKGVHELGGTIHSERLVVFHLIADSTAISQSSNWEVSLGGFPDSINRVLSIFVIADGSAEVQNCSIAIRDPLSGIDHIIWAWDVLDDIEKRVRWDDGGGTGADTALVPLGTAFGGAPNIIARTGAQASMPTLVFHGATQAFGAGDVTTKALISVCRPDHGNPAPGEPSSHGLPIPGW